MLGDARAAGRGDDRREGRDVEGGEAVAAGAARVEQRAADLDRCRHGARRPREARQLLHRLPLHAQRDDEARDLGGRGVAPHDHLEGRGGLLLGEVLAPDDL